MHSLSDLLSDFVTLWSVRVARLPPDPKHPYGTVVCFVCRLCGRVPVCVDVLIHSVSMLHVTEGYGKFEAVGSLSVGAILVCCGLGIGVDGLQSLQEVWAGGAGQALPTFTIPFFPGTACSYILYVTLACYRLTNPLILNAYRSGSQCAVGARCRCSWCLDFGERSAVPRDGQGRRGSEKQSEFAALRGVIRSR